MTEDKLQEAEEALAVEEVPLEEVPLQDVPLQEVPLEEIPPPEVPLQLIPLQLIPLEEIPPEEILLEVVPLEEISLEVAVLELSDEKLQEAEEVPAQELLVEVPDTELQEEEEVPAQELSDDEDLDDLPDLEVVPVHRILFTRPVFARIGPRRRGANQMGLISATFRVELYDERYYLVLQENRHVGIWRFRVSHIRDITINPTAVDVITFHEHVMLELPPVQPSEETSAAVFARVIIPILPQDAILHGIYGQIVSIW